jgi:hypothetical protein
MVQQATGRWHTIIGWGLFDRTAKLAHYNGEAKKAPKRAAEERQAKLFIWLKIFNRHVQERADTHTKANVQAETNGDRWPR